MATVLLWGFLDFSGGEVSEVDAEEDCEDTDSLLPREASSGFRETFSEDGATTQETGSRERDTHTRQGFGSTMTLMNIIRW